MSNLYLKTEEPKREVILSLGEILRLRNIIDDMLDGVSNLPMDMHYFHIGETDNKMINCGWGNNESSKSTKDCASDTKIFPKGKS